MCCLTSALEISRSFATRMASALEGLSVEMPSIDGGMPVCADTSCAYSLYVLWNSWSDAPGMCPADAPSGPTIMRPM